MGGRSDRDDASSFAVRHWLGPAGSCLTPQDRPLSDRFVVHLHRTLRDAGGGGEPGVEWLERRLLESGIDLHEVIRRESQRQAAHQVCVGNCVTSLRLLAALDWNSFFEKTSHVEQVLVGDPGRSYLPKERLQACATYQVPVSRALEDSEVKKTTVWRFA